MALTRSQYVLMEGVVIWHNDCLWCVDDNAVTQVSAYTHYVRVGRDMPIKEAVFSKSVWNLVGGSGSGGGVGQSCGNTMPNLSDLVPFHSEQVENFYLLGKYKYIKLIQFCILYFDFD